MVHVEGYDGGAARCCQTDNVAAIIAPPKMVAPAVRMWVEQAHFIFCGRVDGYNLRSLEFITGMAGHAEVFEGCFSTGYLWNNVINHKASAGDFNYRVTVCATTKRRGYDFLSQ